MFVFVTLNIDVPDSSPVTARYHSTALQTFEEGCKQTCSHLPRNVPACHKPEDIYYISCNY